MATSQQKKGCLGILSLDTQFLRILGDVGNPNSYPCSSVIKVVDGADAALIVKDGLPEEVLLERFEIAARELQEEGAQAIVSTCGFLITAQSRIASQVSIPVMLSALCMLPTVRAVTSKRVGVLTASRSALGATALEAALTNADDVVIHGMENDPIFANTFLATRDQQARDFDRDAMEQIVIAQATALVEKAPDIGAILLECGNLPPYTNAIRAATGRPVYHLLDGARWMMAANG